MLANALIFGSSKPSLNQPEIENICLEDKFLLNEISQKYYLSMQKSKNVLQHRAKVISRSREFSMRMFSQKYTILSAKFAHAWWADGKFMLQHFHLRKLSSLSLIVKFQKFHQFRVVFFPSFFFMRTKFSFGDYRFSELISNSCSNCSAQRWKEWKNVHTKKPKK